MDFDIEMGEAADVYVTEEPVVHDDILPVDDEQEPGEVDEDAPNGSAQPDSQTMVLTKVHIRGVDVLNTDQIKAYAKEHLAAGNLKYVEWIDDTSANLVFTEESSAAEAIRALSSLEIADATQVAPLELLPAKAFSEKPDANLQIRFAVLSDKKIVGAAQYSRFYLLNPEYDPAERKRNRNYRDRDGEYEYRNGRNNKRGGRREDSVEVYDASMYDDEDTTAAKKSPPKTWYGDRRSRSRSRSRSPRSDRSDRNNDRYARANKGKELFGDSGNGSRRDGFRSSRNRSASPVRSVDGDLRMDDEVEARRAGRRNREGARSIKERLSATSSRNNSSRELFPGNKKELFPSKRMDATEGSNAMMDKVGGNAHVERISTQLSDRISHPSATTARTTTSTDNSNGGGFSIRGMANQQPTGQGLSIKGQASAKELFPDKLGNAGKELFSEKLANRIRRPRQRAEDTW